MRQYADTKGAILACCSRPLSEDSSLEIFGWPSCLVSVLITLTVFGDGDRVPRVERVKCVLKGARINDLLDTSSLRVFEDVFHSVTCRFHSRSCFFDGLSPYVCRARKNEGADVYCIK